MDYILSKIHKRTAFYETTGDERHVMEYNRLKVEYACVFLLAYLWNKNLRKLDEEDREFIFRNITRPTIGTIVRLCRTLDHDKEFFGTEESRATLDAYPRLRNERIGHGFVFDDAIKETAHEFKVLARKLIDDPKSIFADDFDLVLVTNRKDNNYAGIRFCADGNNFLPWLCPIQVGEFQIDNVYAVRGINDYYRLSPFIVITQDEEYFFFRDVSDRMLGRTTYNQALKTGLLTREWREFADDISNDGVRRKSTNGTILNVYENNYSQYIDVGTKSRLLDFLLRNNSSVCGTVWGHGGVGKTATVQSLCEDLSRRSDRKMDYIIFVSAKDRAFSYQIGSIISIDERIDSYQNLLKCINSTIAYPYLDKAEGIIDFKGRILIVIDDYETFPVDEKAKLETFIRSLDIRHHKVLITTRANVIIGEEFQTHELSRDDTTRFLLEVMRSDFPAYSITRAKEELSDATLRDRVYSVTSGRPLFILQFAHIWAQSGSLRDAARHSVKDRDEAIEFLYGRIFDYLSDVGRELFSAISLLVTDSDLSNLVTKLRFVTNMESDEDRFQQGISDLRKLRIIEVYENDFFRVYSAEILKMMRDSFQRAQSGWRGRINQRLLRVSRDKRLDNERALLENANAARYAKGETEVIDLYREILNRGTSPKDIKRQALLNLTDYLFNARGKKHAAINIFNEHEHLFNTDGAVVRMFANYCWAQGERHRAVELILNLFSRVGYGWKEKDAELELLGLCLTYHSIVAIESKDDIKTMLRLGEISKSEFAEKNDEIKKEFRTIYDREGVPLFNRIRKLGLHNLASGARQNVVTGLYHFSGVCMRLTKYNLAYDICKFGLMESQSFLAEPFEKRKNLILAIRRDRDQLTRKKGPDIFPS